MRHLMINTISVHASGFVVVKSIGSINSETSRQLEEHLTDLIRQRQYKIIIDMSETDFISSSGMRVLLSIAGNLRKKDGDIVFLRPTTIVRRIFDTLNLDDYFRFVNSPDEAMAERN